MVYSLILFLVAICYFVYKVASEKPCPPDHRYDLEKEREDIKNGVSFEERDKKRRRGEYWTHKDDIADRKPKEVIPGVVDICRYERDKKVYGVEYTELLRSAGEYKYIRKF